MSEPRSHEAAKPPPQESTATAHQAGLRYVTDEMPGIRREASGRGFRYRYPTGDIVHDEQVLKRIKALAVPPAWTKVWICPDPAGHLQATGRDARGRKQNRYHSRWREVRDDTKYARMLAFGRVLPKIRRRVQADLSLPGLPRQKVLATVVRLLELSLIRVGNPEYARENESFGLTTLRNRHVRVNGSSVRFHFRGKGGKWHDVDVQDRRLAKIIKSCHDLPGQELFQYSDEQTKHQPITSEDVNDYLRELTGKDFTAKDFRTWAGTVLAAMALREFEPCSTKESKKNIVRAIESVAERLGNTVAVCRKCYVHPEVLQGYTEGVLLEALQQRGKIRASKHTFPAIGLHSDEQAVLKFLQQRYATASRRLELQLGASLKKQRADVAASLPSRRHRPAAIRIRMPARHMRVFRLSNGRLK